MKISQFAIDRPIFTIMATLIVILIGVVALSRLPIDLMPDITYPTLSVSTSYENASPEEIEELVTRPIEEAMSSVPGVEEITSISTEGSSNIRMTFVWGTDLDVAANDIRDRLDRILSRLPDEVDRPALRKFDLAGFPVMILGASSNLDPIQMRKIIDDQIKYRIERIPGVAYLDIFGGVEREIHVDLHLDRIKALGLSLDQIMSTIEAENINLPAGELYSGNLKVLVRTPGEFANLDELRQTVLAISDGAVIKLKDIADVEDAWEKPTRIVRINGKPGIRLGLFKQSGKNTVTVAKAALKELKKINQDFPQINLTPIIDTSEYIRRSVRNVGFSAIYGGILAIIVLLFFLGNFASTAVIATAIPISIIATFALIYFGGFTLNLMTLGGLALGVGMLVDNAIVVLENIYRLRETGLTPYQAAVEGSQEVTAAIIASTLTTLAVFLPMIFIKGMSGIMFKQMAYVIGFSLLCSLAVALTIIPMLSAKVLHPENLDNPEKRKNLVRKVMYINKRIFRSIETQYGRILRFSMNHRKIVVGVILLSLLASLALIPLIGIEFMPTADEGEVRVNAEMEVGTRLELIDEKFRKIETIVSESVPEAENTSASIGGSWRSSGGHTGQLRISLKTQAERSRSSQEIADDLRKRLNGIPGIKIRTRAGQGLFILRMGSSQGEQVQIEIRGHDLSIADELARRIMDFVEKVEGVTDVQLSLDVGAPEELILVDRKKAADINLSIKQIANALQTILSGTKAGNFREGGSEYSIRVKVKDSEQIGLDELLDLTLVNSDGEPVVLRNVVNIQGTTGPVQIERKNQERTVTVSANISGRDLGSIIAEIRQKLRSIPIPKDFSINFGGDYEEQQKAFRELLLSLLLSILLVYMVMACQFESLRDPFVVMFSVPLAIIGVVLILFLTHTTFNIQVFIGCIMLGGIVVNNAILLVDQTNLLRRRDKMPLREAIENACSHRLRPVLMTALTTILGLIPLGLGIGEGGEAQAPLARSVIGGLLSATLITLIFIPILYSIFEQRLKRKGPGQVSHTVSNILIFLCIAGIFQSLFSPRPLHANSPGEPPPVMRQEERPDGKRIFNPSAPPPALSSDHPSPVLAEGDKTLEIGIKEAVLTAIENNRALAVERFEPSISRTYEDQERALFDPEFTGEISGSREEAGLNQDTSGSLTNTKTDKADIKAGITNFFPTGTQVSLNLATDRTWFDLYGDHYSTHAGLSVTQAILKGAGIKTNLVNLRQAKLDTFSSVHELRGFTESLIAQVEETYWEYALAQERIEISIESLRLAEQQMAETEERIKIGTLPEIERVASQAEIALRREDLINSRSDFNKVRLKLLKLINPPGPDLWDREIAIQDKPAMFDIELDDVNAHIELGLQKRSDLNQARLESQKGDLQIVKTRNGLLPRMDFFINLGISGYADSFSGSFKDFDGDHYDIQAGIRFEYPFFNKSAKAVHKRAVLSKNQVDEALENLSQLIEMDIRLAYIEVNRSKEQVLATASTKKFQAEKMRAETEKFRVGKSTAFLVAQAQRDFIASQISEVEALVQYLKAIVELYRLEGSILDRHGISL